MKSIFLFAALCFTQLVFAQAPSANFTISDEDLILCEGDCIYVTNNSTGGDLTYGWSFQGATPSTYIGQNPGPICFPVSSGSTPFAITLVATNASGVTSTLTQFVIVNTTPTMNLTLSDTTAGAYVEINDTTINMYQNAYLFAEGTPAGGNLYWYPSGVVSDSLLGCASCVAGDSLTVNPFFTTNYVATYTLNGCSVSDTVLVTVNFASQVLVELPNSFSPNGDGENDFFRVLTNVDKDQNFTNNSNNGFQEGGAIAEIDLRVFNRYGQMVFRTTNPHEGWDGTFKGKPLNPATYTYILNFRTIDGRSDDRSGNVTLFR
ncbi:MAG: gliding motility-associated C-terminal domain-containing protein [Crocinitomicaceae bacterium]|nr:gliding motility-associated C-terminal domain-containing protein [Crocinitomicaceae bacterium]MBP6031887.1 gliding motility-associated C-terminal domain-containing protein [Crocinitomicaceae bacterium]